MQGRVAIAAPRRRSLDAHLCAQARTLRIRLTDGLNFSIAHSTSPLPPLGSMPHRFHEIARAAGAKKTYRKMPVAAEAARQFPVSPCNVHERQFVRAPSCYAL